MKKFNQFLEQAGLYEKVVDEIEKIVHDKGKMTVYGYKTVGTAMKGERSDEKPLVIVSKMKMGKKIIATKSGKPVSIKPLAGKDMVNVYDERGRILLYNVSDYEW